MVLSRREKYVFIGAVLLLVWLVLDRFALSRLLASRTESESQKKALLADLNRAGATLRHSQQLSPRWQEMTRTGIKGEPGEAESQIFHTIHAWAVETGVSLSLLRPDRLTEKTVLPEIAFQAVGTGSMESIAKLLWRIQNATIPVRVTELQLAARTEGADDLSVQMRLSTVYLPGARRPVVQTAPAPKGVGR
jgi:hypothetical protein